MKKILLFPYHPDMHVLLENKDYLKEFQICGFISFKEDKDIVSFLNSRLGAGDKTNSDFLDESDIVIILDNYRDYKIDKYYEVIEDALSKKKEVWITPVAKTQLELGEYDGQYRILENLPKGMNEIDEEYSARDDFRVGIRMYETDTPIIAVAGQGKSCDKFAVQLLMKEALADDYKLISVCTNPLGALFGCYTIPAFLYSEHISFQEKVVKFNYYIRKISKMHDPDGILLGIPEGITPFSEKEYNHFGEYALIISNAVLIDMAVMCVYFTSGKLSDDGFVRFVNYCKGRFDMPVFAGAISRYIYDVPTQPNEKVTFDLLEDTFLQKYSPNLESVRFPMIDLMDREKAAETIKRTVKMLEENVSTI